MTNDMTKGSPIKLILSFMVPLLIGNIFQQFYNMADTIIVGRTISVEALAAVGATGSISFLIVGFVQGVTSGFAVITAQRFGAGSENGVRRSVATSIILGIAVTIVMTAISVLAARPLLEIMKTPSDIIDDSYNYIIVIFEGIAAAVFFNLFSSILRSLGDSKTPLVFLIIASIINIILDFVFILTFKMGVAGAGWATVIAQFSITAIGTMVIQSALNSLGSTAVAAFTAGSKIDQFATQPLASLGVAVATYTAQNYGARKLERIKKGVTGAAIIATVCGIVGGFVVITFAKPLVALFVGSGQNEVMSLSKEYLVLNGVFYVILGLLFVYRNALQGIGSSMIAFFGGVWELVMRSLVAFVLVSYLKFAAVCIASPVAWFGATIWLMIAYFIIINRIIKKANFAKINY